MNETPKHGNLSLLTITKELTDILDAELHESKEIVVDRYFHRLSEELEMNGLQTHATKLSPIREKFLESILPLYSKLEIQREKVQQKIEKRDWKKYVIGTILVANVFEAVITRGRSFAPAFLFTSMLVESAIGAGIYSAVNGVSKLKQQHLKKKYFNAVKKIHEREEIDQRYNSFQEIMDGDLQKAESFQLLTQYQSPKEFWKDYKIVYLHDPTTKESIQTLGVDKFSDFLSMHINGAYSSTKRNKRLEDLFLSAHKHYLSTQKNEYIATFLNNFGGTKR